MERRHELRLTQKQTLIMTQKLRQALKLLTLPTLELREELKTELQTNPLLEEVDDYSDAPEAPESDTADDREGDSTDDVDWEAYLQDASDAGTVPTPERREEQYERVNVSAVTLEDLLRQQLLLRITGPEDEAVMDFILGSVDERGYLTITDEEIAEHTGAEIERVERLVRWLTECEPGGVGHGISGSASSSSSGSGTRRTSSPTRSSRSSGKRSRTAGSPTSPGR